MARRQTLGPFHRRRSARRADADGLLHLGNPGRGSHHRGRHRLHRRGVGQARPHAPALPDRDAAGARHRSRHGRRRRADASALRPCRQLPQVRPRALPFADARDGFRHRPLHALPQVRPQLRGRGRGRHGEAQLQGPRRAARRRLRPRARHQPASRRRPYARPADRARDDAARLGRAGLGCRALLRAHAEEPVLHPGLQSRRDGRRLPDLRTAGRLA